jgi:hypothetical protein
LTHKTHWVPTYIPTRLSVHPRSSPSPQRPLQIHVPQQGSGWCSALVCHHSDPLVALIYVDWPHQCLGSGAVSIDPMPYSADDGISCESLYPSVPLEQASPNCRDIQGQDTIAKMSHLVLSHNQVTRNRHHFGVVGGHCDRTTSEMRGPSPQDRSCDSR